MTTENYYLVIDLEATCDEHHRIPRDRTEIIEIGAVLVAASTLELEGEFQTFVRPIVHPELTPFCKQLTSIRQEQVATAPKFPEALDLLRAFVGTRRVLFCSWGDYDKAQFLRDAGRHRVKLPFGNDHLNLKRAFSERLGGVRPCGVSSALARVGLRFQGTAHRGIDDARNIARLLPSALGRSS